jgi:excisionase family DNA binding protein
MAEILEQKEILTLNELSIYTGFSKSHIYKLTHNNKIPHYKPGGKCCFFLLDEVKNWILTNRVSTKTELEIQANTFLFNSKSKKK